MLAGLRDGPPYCAVTGAVSAMLPPAVDLRGGHGEETPLRIMLMRGGGAFGCSGFMYLLGEWLHGIARCIYHESLRVGVVATQLPFLPRAAEYHHYDLLYLLLMYFWRRNQSFILWFSVLQASHEPVIQSVIYGFTALCYSFHAPQIAPVDLDHTAFIPPNGNTRDGPLVILHGFFGSKRNWTSLANAFLRGTGRPVYTLDLRNQGTSPHVSPMTYQHMAADVLHFLRKHSLSNVSLLGHSMGGKVAMTVALSASVASSPGLLSNLIIEDITPKRAPLAPDFRRYIEAMEKIEAKGVKTLKEANEVLDAYEQDRAIRTFLLTNLVLPKCPSTPAKFQIPLPILGNAIDEIGSFPYESGQRTWDGRALFVKGARSTWVNGQSLPVAQSFFPRMKLQELDTGHWVHAEKPSEFKQVVLDFIS
ncbi:Alpha/Beta hydrolase protein [Infundibulicybe gibba]|nr:Alpha/Beta hydrolase protein [Infundibulicybe gibba]